MLSKQSNPANKEVYDFTLNIFSDMAIYWFGVGHTGIKELRDDEFAELNRKIIKKARNYLCISSWLIYTFLSFIFGIGVVYTDILYGTHSYSIINCLVTFSLGFLFSMLGFSFFYLCIQEAFRINNGGGFSRRQIKYFVEEGGVHIKDRDISSRDHKFSYTQFPGRPTYDC